MIELAELLLSDGTTTIDLLSLATAAGLHLRSWVPASSRYKGQGVWHDSPLADGKRPAFHAWDATEEAMRFTAVGLTTDDLAHRTADLRNLLQQAWDYFENDWPQSGPVYLIRRARGETNLAYSLVLGGEAPQDGEYTAEASAVSYTVGYEGWDVRIWREEHWRDTVPGGEGTCTPNAGYQFVHRPCYIDFAANGIITVPAGGVLDDLADDAMTAEMWVRIDGATTCILLDKGNMVAGWNLAVVFPGGNISATIVCAVADGVQVTANATLTVDGLWHHVAMTWDDVTYLRPRIWIDGVEATYIPAAGQDRNGAIVADGAHNLLIGNDVGVAFDLDGAAGWTRVSDSVRYAAGFTPDPRCDPPAIDVNTIGQWIGEECAGTNIRNVEGTAAFDGTLANGGFDCDCYDWVGNIDPADDSIDYSCDEDDIEVFIRNSHARAQLTQIWHVDTSLGNWTGNLVEQSSYELLPNPVEVGDFVYFGIDSAAQYYGPFRNLVFDLVDNAVDITGTWWYYSSVGPGWAALGTQDGTLQLCRTGTCAMIWFLVRAHSPLPGNTWIPFAVHGITAYWVRFEVTGVNDVPRP
ncbi:LamG domain-containing protein, partial [Patescibacteria group bacterium]|nr:LamG domain-containing protein [Patescibacteria group bacterium]